MKLEKDSEFSLFSPESTLPTEERTQFRSRAADIFGALSAAPSSAAPSERSGAMLPPPPVFSTVVSDKAPARDLRDKLNKKRHGLFSGSRGRHFRAQHEISPAKFTKYTLRDTDLTDDRENKAIALDFLNGLQDREGSAANAAEELTDFTCPTLAERASTEEHTESPEKIIFKKPDNEKQTELPLSTRGHRFAVMHEEYVVGQTKPKPRDVTRPRDVIRPRDVTRSKGKERTVVAACYLDEEEDEID